MVHGTPYPPQYPPHYQPQYPPHYQSHYLQQQAPPPPKPPRLPWAARWWPAPSAPPSTVVQVGAGTAALLAATLGLSPRPGLNVGLVALVAGLTWIVQGRGRRDRGDLVLGLIGLGLLAVPALRDSPWLVALSMSAGVGLLAVVTTGARRWPAVLLSMPAFVLGGMRSVSWVRPRLTGHHPPGGTGPWVRGALVGVSLTVVVAALLGAVDPAYAKVLGAINPVRSPSELVVRLLLAGGVAGAVTAGAFGLAATPYWHRLVVGVRHRPAVEWVLPLALLDMVLLLFVALQGVMLFGGADVLLGGDATYASRVHEGFWQLVAVTLITIALLAWSARSARPHGRDRRLLAAVGGGLVALTMVVVASALQRLWLYQQAYGWTVLRVVVACVELWLGSVLLLVAITWVLRRVHRCGRLLPAWAGLALLLLAVAGPDAVVARLDVDRFEQTGKIDVRYLSRLSADAVPALDRLPAPTRACVMQGRGPAGDPWYGASVARATADTVLRDRGVVTCLG
jgi:hypothetical protein